MARAKYGKGFFDKLGALSLLLLLSPMFLLVCFLLFFYNKGEVFFCQERPGLNSRIFKIIKFKTMSDVRGLKGEVLPDADRMTPLGKWIRSLSLDELPQLLNVLKGEMSLVGPRPLLKEYLAVYTAVQQRRHEVKPGITGWAQVNGRNGISWEKKFALDVWYVEHQSFSLDVTILLLTLTQVFRREGITQDHHASMEPFKGTHQD